jgi:hypothetical protein
VREFAGEWFGGVLTMSTAVIPTKVGIQKYALDSGFRRNDEQQFAIY